MGNGISENFTVNPGETIVYYMTMGGNDQNLVDTSHQIAIGGMPGGAKLPNGQDASWYQFDLTLNADLSFEKLTLNYSGTGGAGNSTQNGFNATYATANTTTVNGVQTTTFQNSTNIWSPYSSSSTDGNWYLPPNSPPSKWEPVIYWNNPPNEVNPIIGLAWIA